MSRPSVTFLFVDDGEIIGTPNCCATLPPASELPDATSPISATTLSSLISRCTTLPASLDFDASSRVLTAI